MLLFLQENYARLDYSLHIFKQKRIFFFAIVDRNKMILSNLIEINIFIFIPYLVIARELDF